MMSSSNPPWQERIFTGMNSSMLCIIKYLHPKPAVNGHFVNYMARDCAKDLTAAHWDEVTWKTVLEMFSKFQSNILNKSFKDILGSSFLWPMDKESNLYFQNMSSWSKKVQPTWSLTQQNQVPVPLLVLKAVPVNKKIQIKKKQWMTVDSIW